VAKIYLLTHTIERFAEFPDVDVRGLAVTCLGHLARIHWKLNVKEVTDAQLEPSRVSRPALTPSAHGCIYDLPTLVPTPCVIRFDISSLPADRLFPAIHQDSLTNRI